MIENRLEKSTADVCTSLWDEITIPIPVHYRNRIFLEFYYGIEKEPGKFDLFLRDYLRFERKHGKIKEVE